MHFTPALMATLALGTAVQATAAPESNSVSSNPAPVVSSASAHELNHSDLQAWLDGLLPYALDRNDIAGAVIVVVKDGEVLLQKGYGYADMAKKIPVDPQRTLFRTGSVGKLFTWTALMQLVEQGKLELDRDISDYLDFELPRSFLKPITLRHLMTHRPGLDQPLKRLIVADPKLLAPLDQYLKAHIPSQVFAPGEVPAYSNYGAALGGYIVERVSGLSFEEYCERHIFQPLGMQRSTFRQPLPPVLATHVSKGYDKASGEPFYFELGNPRPAGTMSSTGADMAQFMIAHLEAREGESGLLKRETAHLMHDSITRSIPPLDGMALGFFERTDRRGRRIISHGGDTQVFHSDLQLLIDDGVGIYMSFNSTGDDDIRATLLDEFLDRYFPAPPMQRQPTTATAAEHAEVIARSGPYRSTYRPKSSFFDLAGLLGQQRATVTDDGTLIMSGLTVANGDPQRWREIGPYLWEEIGGRNELLAAKVIDGEVRFVGSGISSGVELLQPVPAYQSADWNTPLLIASAAVLAVTAALWPVLALVRRRYGVLHVLEKREELAYRLARLAALVDLAFLGGWALVIDATSDDLAMLDGRIDPWIVLLHIVGVLVLAGAAAAVWNAWLTWRGSRPLAARLWSAAMALACVAVVWFMLAFNLLRGLNY